MTNSEIAALALDIIANPASRAGDPSVTVSREGRSFDAVRRVSVSIYWADADEAQRAVVSDDTWVSMLRNLLTLNP